MADLNKYRLEQPDYAVAFRRFLRNPSEASPEVQVFLRNIQKIVGKDIYFLALPPFDTTCESIDDVRPYIWYSIIDGTNVKTLNCSTHLPDRLLFNIEIYSCDPSEIYYLETMLRNALADYEGNFGGINVQDVQIESQSSDYISGGVNTPKISWYLRMLMVEVIPLNCACPPNNSKFPSTPENTPVA